MNFLKNLRTRKCIVGSFAVAEILGLFFYLYIIQKTWEIERKLNLVANIACGNDNEAPQDAEAQVAAAEERIFFLEQELQALKWQVDRGPTPQANASQHPDDLPGTTAGEAREFEIAPGVKIQMCWIPSGEFTMSSPVDEVGRRDDIESPHRVAIRSGFWMAKTELTQAQWRAAGGIDTTGRPSQALDGKRVLTWDPRLFDTDEFRGDLLPVERITWTEAQQWCEQVTQLQQANGRIATGWQFALPTEAEWEYACRAGTETAFNDGNNLTTRPREKCLPLDDMAWYSSNSEEHTHPVGLKKANAWGLYDMHGNVMEWCADWYEDWPSNVDTSLLSDPKGPLLGQYRVFRGGSWDDSQAGCRSASRRRYSPSYFDKNLGLRPILHLIKNP